MKIVVLALSGILTCMLFNSCHKEPEFSDITGYYELSVDTIAYYEEHGVTKSAKPRANGVLDLGTIYIYKKGDAYKIKSCCHENCNLIVYDFALNYDTDKNVINSDSIQFMNLGFGDCMKSFKIPIINGAYSANRKVIKSYCILQAGYWENSTTHPPAYILVDAKCQFFLTKIKELKDMTSLPF